MEWNGEDMLQPMTRDPGHWLLDLMKRMEAAKLKNVTLNYRSADYSEVKPTDNQLPSDTACRVILVAVGSPRSVSVVYSIVKASPSAAALKFTVTTLNLS